MQSDHDDVPDYDVSSSASARVFSSVSVERSQQRSQSPSRPASSSRPQEQDARPFSVPIGFFSNMSPGSATDVPVENKQKYPEPVATSRVPKPASRSRSRKRSRALTRSPKRTRSQEQRRSRRPPRSTTRSPIVRNPPRRRRRAKDGQDGGESPSASVHLKPRRSQETRDKKWKPNWKNKNWWKAKWKSDWKNWKWDDWKKWKGWKDGW